MLARVELCAYLFKHRLDHHYCQSYYNANLQLRIN